MKPEIITTQSLYNGLQALLDKDSAYAVAKFLGAAKQSACSWRDGKTTMDEEHALKAAEALKLDADFVLASLAAERAAKVHHTESAAAWHRIALRLATAASVTFLGVFVVFSQVSHVL